ncbi:glutamate 5-kinase [Candidatus Palauibacter sp.]|uniref:glutamate 5-kinase n=1 Tax=Candidatus Palauibacter sp. TaxID=3101350 RepID=UPI003B0276ED
MTQAQHLPSPRREPVAPEVTREAIARAGRIVLKVGTGVLTHPDGSIALARLFGVVEAASRLRREGREVLIVTSGAVGLGRVALQLPEPPETAELKQTCAAVGQSRLMELYQQGFARLGINCAQILITWTDFDDRVRYLNLHETLQSLFRLGVVPVVNENDAISLNDRVYRGTGKRPIFDDNDRLGALVASELAADLIVLLTDVPGVMTADPRRDAAARLIPRIDRAEDHVIDVDGRSEAGRGGMASKLEAASVASRSRWIAYCSHPRGTLVLRPEAADRLREGATLRAGGAAKAEGLFRRGDVVEIRAPDGSLVGRGVVAVDAAIARESIARRTAPFGGLELVHGEHIILKDRSDG